MSIEVLSAEKFRQKLAGLVDIRKILPDEQIDEIKSEAVKFCAILAEVFGDDLDRKTLWERIGNGLVVCAAKSAGDWELFLNEMFKFIKADPGKVAANKSLSVFIEKMILKNKEYKEQFIRECETKHMFICVKARLFWNANKNKPKEVFTNGILSDDGFVDDIPEGGK